MKEPKDTLKTYFQTGNLLHKEHFEALVDSYVHKEDLTEINQVSLETNAFNLVKNTVFVDVNHGDDNTGSLEDSKHAFQTIDAALQSLPEWDNTSIWKIYLISEGIYPITQQLPLRGLTFESNAVVTIDVQIEGEILPHQPEINGNVHLILITFNLPLGTYKHHGIYGYFNLNRGYVELNINRLDLNFSAFTAFAYFLNLNRGFKAEIDNVVTNVSLFYSRNFSNRISLNDILPIKNELRIDTIEFTSTDGNKIDVYYNDLRHNADKAYVKINNVINNSGKIAHLAAGNDIDVKVGNVLEGNATTSIIGHRVGYTIKNGSVEFMNSTLWDTMLKDKGVSGYVTVYGNVKTWMRDGTITYTVISLNATLHFKNFTIENFISANPNIYIFDFWQLNDETAKVIFENCYIKSNCRTLRSRSGVATSFYSWGNNIFDDAGDTVLHSIESYLYGHLGEVFKINKTGTFYTKTIRTDPNSVGETAIQFIDYLNEF